MKISTHKRKVVAGSLSISAIVCIVLGWMILSNVYQNEYTFPSIFHIFKSLGEILSTPSDLKAIGMTILRAILSVIITVGIGIIITSIYMICPITISFFNPIIRIMRSVPLAVISIFILILAKEKTQPYFITILMTLPVVFEGLITATNEIGHEIIDEMRLLKGSIFIKIRKIYIPIIFPYIMMTIIQALGMSFKVLIMGEYLCYTNVSIGKNLYDLKALGMVGLLAYGILIVVIVSILEFMIWLIKIKVIYQRNSLRFNKKF